MMILCLNREILLKLNNYTLLKTPFIWILILMNIYKQINNIPFKIQFYLLFKYSSNNQSLKTFIINVKISVSILSKSLRSLYTYFYIYNNNLSFIILYCKFHVWFYFEITLTNIKWFIFEFTITIYIFFLLLKIKNELYNLLKYFIFLKNR